MAKCKRRITFDKKINSQKHVASFEILEATTHAHMGAWVFIQFIEHKRACLDLLNHQNDKMGLPITTMLFFTINNVLLSISKVAQRHEATKEGLSF